METSEIDRLKQELSWAKARLAQLSRTNMEITEAHIMELAKDNGVGDLFGDVNMTHDLMKFSFALAGLVQRQDNPWVVRFAWSGTPWIPFADPVRRPLENEQFIFKDFDGNVGLGWYCKEDESEWIGHWMPVP
jgi:hypothetical protein